MSFNTNNPNQQWQQQQVQPVNPQATPATSPPGGVNYQQSQQSYNFQNGNMQGQHHQSQQSWSWQGQTTTSTPILQSPPMLLQSNAHHQLHQQMHQNALNQSHQALAHHQQIMNMQQSMAQNMASMMSSMNSTTSVQQVSQQPQIAYQSAQQQNQIAYQTASPQQQQQFVQPAQQPQVAYTNVSPTGTQQRPAITSPTSVPAQPQYQQSIHQQPQQYQRPVSQHPQQAVTSPGILSPIQQNSQQNPQPALNVQPSQTQQLIQGSPQQTYQDPRYDVLDKQRKKDIEDMNRTGAQISQRLRDLEQSNARAQNEQDAKNREVRQLQEQLAAVNRQRLQDAERNSQQLAELVRSQAASPPAQTSAFDMSALQKVIRETQARQLSAADIERVIEDQVSKRLAGMATKADIQNAGAQMQNALSQVPAGLNEQQVQQAVNRELNNVMQDVANRVSQQRRLAGGTTQNTQPMQSPQSQMQTDFVIEELPDDDDVVVHRVPVNHLTLQGAGPIAQLQCIGQAFPTTSAPEGPESQASVTRVAQQQMLQQPPTIRQSSQMPRFAAIEASPRGISNDLALQARPSVPPVSSMAGQGAVQTAPSISSTNLLAPEATSVHHSVPQSSLTLARPGSQAQPAPSGFQQAMLPPAGSHVTGNAMTLVNSSTAPSAMDLTHNQNMPPPGYAPQQRQVAMPQRQLEAAPAPAQQLAMASRPVIQQVHGVAPVGTQQQQIQAAVPYRQLEAAPVPMQQLQMTRPQSVVPQTQGAAQMATQPQQIASNAPMRQLEAPPGTSTNLSATGQELVHQSIDITRNAPRQ